MKVALQTISAQVSWGTSDWVQTHAPLEYCLVVKSMLGAHQEKLPYTCSLCHNIWMAAKTNSENIKIKAYKIYLYYEQWKQYHINLVENEVL